MSTAPPEVSGSRPRWLALDLFRFAAVCLMVQGHVFSTLLDEATKSERWYRHHAFVHGYTAPMFLFGAGLAFGYTTFRAWGEQSRWSAASRARFKRYATLLVIGYALHLPTLSLTRLLSLSEARLASFVRVDVLQHIGVSLAICQLLVLLLKRERAFVGVVSVLAALAIACAPWLWGIDLRTSGLPLWLAGYVNASTGSTFPLVPWCGFTLVGILVAYAVLARGKTASSVSTRVRWPFAMLAAIFLIAPVIVDRFGPWPWPPHNFWKTNPLFFFWRLGNVLAVLAVACFLERAMERFGWVATEAKTRASRSARRVLDWVKAAGAESLIIYVAHLVILHGSVLGPGIKASKTFGAGRLGLAEASVVAFLLLAAMLVLARVWAALGRMRKVTRTAIRVSLASAVAVVLLLVR